MHSDAHEDKMHLVEDRGKEDPFDKGEDQPEDKGDDWMQAPHQ